MLSFTEVTLSIDTYKTSHPNKGRHSANYWYGEACIAEVTPEHIYDKDGGRMPNEG